MPFEEIQNSASILNHSRGPIPPRASRHLLGEGFYLEVILDINTQYVFYAQALFWCVCGMRIVQRLLPVGVHSDRERVPELSEGPKKGIVLPPLQW